MLIAYILVVIGSVVASWAIWKSNKIKLLKNLGFILFFMTLGVAILGAFVHLF